MAQLRDGRQVDELEPRASSFTVSCMLTTRVCRIVAKSAKTVIRASQTDVQRQFFVFDLPGRPAKNNRVSFTITFRAAEVRSHHVPHPWAAVQ